MPSRWRALVLFVLVMVARDALRAGTYLVRLSDRTGAIVVSRLVKE